MILLLVALEAFLRPFLLARFLILLGLFSLLNLIYTFLFIKKFFPPSSISLLLGLDFLLVLVADFLSGGLFNHLPIFFYLLLITGGSSLISLKSSRRLTQLAIIFSFFLFFLHLFNPSIFPFSNPEDYSQTTFLLQSLAERLLFLGGFFLVLSRFLTRKEVEEKKIQEEKEETRKIIQSLGEGFLILDEEGKVLEASPEVEKMIETKIFSLLGKPFLADPQVFSATLEFPDGMPFDWIEEVKQEKKAKSYNFKVLFPLEDRHIQATLVPILKNNKVTRIAVLLKNITEALKLEEMKSDFLSTVSHELRTPLTTIKGYASLLLNPKGKFDEGKRKEFLLLIEQQTERLNRLINDLLDVSRLEAQRLDLRKQPTQIKNLIEKVIVNLRLPKEKQRIVTSFPPDFPLALIDPDRLEQVFANLIDNALKYSPPKEPVKIEGKVKENELVVIVEDRGIGIPPSELPHIFEKFHRVDRSLSRQVEGIGLGLYIAKNLVELHGGKIWCESQPKKGSKFFVSLPIYSDNFERF